MKRHISLFAIVALVGAANANLITNGDFELSVPSNGTGNGWTTFNIDGAGGWRATGGNPSGNFILNDNGAAGDDPTMFQDVALVVGQMYTVTVDVARGNISQTGNNDFRISIDGNDWNHPVPPSNTAFVTYSHTFVAQSVNATLTLIGEDFQDSDPRVDNVTLNAVPEPASLFALALGALALRRRRK